MSRRRQGLEGCSHEPTDPEDGRQRQKLEAGRILPLRLWRKHGPAHTLISDLQPPQLGEDTFSCFKSPVCGTCYSGPARLTHTRLSGSIPFAVVSASSELV